MVLIPCYECEREISDQAAACPHCGAPKSTPKPTGKLFGMCKALQILAVLVSVCLSGASAQEQPSSPAEAPTLTGADEVHLDFLVLGGITANPSRRHAAGGLWASVDWRGWGVLAVGTLGWGGDYESRLFAGAGTRRFFRLGRLSIAGLAGYGYYAEAEDAPTGARSNANGVLLGGIARVRLGGVSLGFMISDLTGRYAGLRIAEPFRFHVLRYSVGIGVTVGG
jgi:hypothetical protein